MRVSCELGVAVVTPLFREFISLKNFSIFYSVIDNQDKLRLLHHCDTLCADHLLSLIYQSVVTQFSLSYVM